MKLKTLASRLKSTPARLASVAPNSWRTNKQTSGQRGYDYKWQKARARYLMANPLCVECARAGQVTAAVVVDHKIPHRGDMALFWDESTWQGLCVNHHSSDAQKRDNRIVNS